MPLSRLIEGHADNCGPAAFNQQLSEKRAAAGLDSPVERGIDASCIRANGLGESQPIASNGTTQGRSKNRRVELIMVDATSLPPMAMPETTTDPAPASDSAAEYPTPEGCNAGPSQVLHRRPGTEV